MSDARVVRTEIPGCVPARQRGRWRGDDNAIGLAMRIGAPELLLALGCSALTLMFIGVALGDRVADELASLGLGAVLGLAIVFWLMVLRERRRGGE